LRSERAPLRRPENAAPARGPAHNRWLYAGAITALIGSWGTTWAAIRIGLGGVPPFTGAAARFVIGAIVLALVAPRL
jgi:drug/metabolite transporter (DMT)-like permease